MRSLCVKYAWLCAGRASVISAYAPELVRNRTCPRPSTDAPPSYHTWTAHVSRSFHLRSRSVHVWTRSVSDSCVRRASNVRGILHRICSYALLCVICQWFVSECKWYVHGLCMIHAWFVSNFCHRHLRNVVNFSTHKHTQTQSVRDLWVIHAWSAVWLAVYFVIGLEEISICNLIVVQYQLYFQMKKCTFLRRLQNYWTVTLWGSTTRSRARKRKRYILIGRIFHHSSNG